MEKEMAQEGNILRKHKGHLQYFIFRCLKYGEQQEYRSIPYVVLSHVILAEEKSAVK